MPNLVNCIMQRCLRICLYLNNMCARGVRVCQEHWRAICGSNRQFECNCVLFNDRNHPSGRCAGGLHGCAYVLAFKQSWFPKKQNKTTKTTKKSIFIENQNTNHGQRRQGRSRLPPGLVLTFYRLAFKLFMQKKNNQKKSILP